MAKFRYRNGAELLKKNDNYRGISYIMNRNKYKGNAGDYKNDANGDNFRN